ncbi:uncharacterized protein LOC128272395 [Anopheles cruzii]|uniref:uncharacterized protein LOC128272395 n=1 Tax=Anopheles cruzii TaxID=68878 RepID=UPI0022EC1EC5|nr:uncharacterized protein LOC128272395 [Anopheles cruzii]
MGCINSKKDINDAHSNIFHVINLDDDGTERWSGQLEVSRTELTLYRKGKEPTMWPLKCLRRYGFNVDQFSFEAGRRCATGEGIYAFRCRRAEALFYTVQGRIYSDENVNPNDPYPMPLASNGPSVAARSVSQNNTATRNSGGQGQSAGGQQMQCTFVMNRTGMATSQSLSPNGTIHSNSNQSRSTDTLAMMEGNYLEPTPNRTGATVGSIQPQTITTRFQQGLRLSSVSSGPISPDITSPGSPNSMTNILEVTTLNPLPTSHTSGSVHQGVSNLYQEFPMKDTSAMAMHHHHVHHANHQIVLPLVATAMGLPGSGALLVRNSMDVPPQELAPVAIGTGSVVLSDPNAAASATAAAADCADLPPSTPDGLDSSRMYMNVNISATTCLDGAPCGNAKKPATFTSKSNSSLISISNFNNNNHTHSTGSFDEGQYQNVRTPTSTGPAGMAGGMVVVSGNGAGNIFAQFHARHNSSAQPVGTGFPSDPNRFYENLEPAELKACLLRGRCSKPDIFSNVELPVADHSEPGTPTTTVNRKVNYIVLDLDQSTSSHSISDRAQMSGVLSPTGSVPGVSLNGNVPNGNGIPNSNNNNNNSNTAINLNNVTTAGVTLPAAISPGNCERPTGLLGGVAGACTGGGTVLCGTVGTGVGLLPPESPKKASLGYATIDFNKTVALSNSTTPSSELDCEGSRKTRHNSTVTPLARQSNSVSD